MNTFPRAVRKRKNSTINLTLIRLNQFHLLFVFFIIVGIHLLLNLKQKT